MQKIKTKGVYNFIHFFTPNILILSKSNDSTITALGYMHPRKPMAYHN